MIVTSTRSREVATAGLLYNKAVTDGGKGVDQILDFIQLFASIQTLPSLTNNISLSISVDSQMCAGWL